MNFRVAVFRQQSQYRAAASNLDIVAVGSEAEYFQRGFSGFMKLQFQHVSAVSHLDFCL